MDPRSLEAAPKVALTAVVLIPPETIWEPIQAIRSAHDPQFVRWMPHVTLLYPFVPETRLDEAAERLAPAAAAAEPFEATLGGFGPFVHGRGGAPPGGRPRPPPPRRARPPPPPPPLHLAQRGLKAFVAIPRRDRPATTLPRCRE